ncbi:MAG: hypothetical protein EXS36_19385 [Pedosphaera sp.]|nr:hypothetical protein [Pedosphaera sp.]
MKGFKLAGYIVLLLLAVFFFRGFREHYTAAGNLTVSRVARADGIGVVTPSPSITPVAEETAAVDTNALTETVSASGTEVTNHSTATADVSATNAEATVTAPRTPPAVGVPATSSDLSWAGYMGAFVLIVIALGGLAAWDLAQSIARRAHSSVFQENTEAKRDPEYEEAEKAWTNGEHLEAVRLMREYLKKNPAEYFVALRIAGIYEKDLHNPLAAAMEHEEILCRKLPREKWGWTAIHLSNLYSGKLNHPEKALALLNRVIEEYPETGAARKARSRMGLPEPDAVSGEAATDASSESEPVEESRPSEPEPPSNMPRGFRPRK